MIIGAIGLIVFVLLLSRFLGFSTEPQDYFFALHYDCPRCGHTWIDAHDSIVEGECSRCNLRHIGPVFSDELTRRNKC